MTRPNQILVGDVRDRLRELDSGSVDCIVTSPPYFRLRDYGHDRQLGTEPTIHLWVDDLRAVAKELHRILRPGGTWWLNIADSYSTHVREGTAKKSLLLGPQRLSVALADDGWLVRNHIVWAKPNAVPSSVTDRLSARHETVLLLSKAPRYFFDLDAVRIPATSVARRSRTVVATYPPRSALPRHGQVDLNGGLAKMKRRGAAAHPLGKSPGDVWSIATANYRGAHFATYPLPLAERAILAGCPERVCAQCHKAWRRAPLRDRGRSERLLRTGTLQPQCSCTTSWVPGLVLDPFMGSGTTAIAAARHRRDWLGIELNPAYAKQAQQRISLHSNDIQQLSQLP